MGTMNLNLFKKIIDEIEGKVQFVTLASEENLWLVNKLMKC